jgi:general stress protein 26
VPCSDPGGPRREVPEYAYLRWFSGVVRGRETDMTDTTKTLDIRTIDDALDGMLFAMVGTADGSVWKSRPLTLLKQDGTTLRFLVSTESDWVRALETTGSPTTVTFSDPKKGTHVALQGTARTVEDRALIKELYNPAADIFFDGADDPKARVLEVRVTDGEWWDSPNGRLGQAAALLLAKVTGDESKSGSQGTIRT